MDFDPKVDFDPKIDFDPKMDIDPKMEYSCLDTLYKSFSKKNPKIPNVFSKWLEMTQTDIVTLDVFGKLLNT